MTIARPSGSRRPMDWARRLRVLVAMAWYAPMLLAPRLRAREVVDADVARWVTTSLGRWSRLELFATEPAFRTLYCYRLRRAGAVGALVGGLLGALYPGERTLHIVCGDIGPGLIIQHGFATIIAARRIGANCWVNQQVTIGHRGKSGTGPVIGDDVSVYAGAKVLGDLTVGDGAQVGANAVVLDDVPPYHVAVGVPARVLPPKSRRATGPAGGAAAGSGSAGGGGPTAG